MVISIHEYSDIPIYIQIRDQIILGISNGQLQPGEQLPTVRALALEIGINSMTVSKAYQLLKQEGYIVTDRRSGARVHTNIRQQQSLSAENKSLLQRIAAEAKLNGLTEQAFLEECKKAFGGEW